MPISRILFFYSKHNPPRLPLNPLQRFGTSKRVQSCSYTSSTRHSRGKRTDGDPIIPIETQTPRSWSSWVIPGVVLGFAGIAALVHYNDQRRAIPRGAGVKNETVTAMGPIIGGPFTLTDTENRVVTEQDFLGKWVLLYFGYTCCPDIGPEQLSVTTKAVNKLDSKENLKILPVFVTIDPQRDTPAQLRAYLKEFDSRIVGLTGPVGAVRQMAQEYRVYFRKVEEDGGDYLVESSHNMYLISPNMEVVRCFGVEYNAEELGEAIAKEVKRTNA